MRCLHSLLLLMIAALPSFAHFKAALFNDTSAWYHWGCTGTSTALKERMAELGFEVEAISINAVYALEEVPSFDAFEDAAAFRRFADKNGKTIDLISNSDAIVITGEGTIHDLRDGPRKLLYLAHIAKRIFNKHVEIINHSAYPKDDPELSGSFLDNFQLEKDRAERELELAKSLYRSIYKELDFIAIREPMSKQAMEEIGIESTLSFDCLPLYIQKHYFLQKQVQEKTVLVAGSVAYTASGAKQICRYLERLTQSGYAIQVLIGAAAFPSKDDASFVHFLNAHCKAPWQLIEASSMEEWLSAINHSALLVSGRFHHSIAAFCLNTPFVALNSNTHKVHGIVALFGEEDPLLFSDPHLGERLWHRTDAALRAPSLDNQAKIQEILPLAERNFDGLRTLHFH